MQNRLSVSNFLFIKLEQGLLHLCQCFAVTLFYQIAKGMQVKRPGKVSVYVTESREHRCFLTCKGPGGGEVGGNEKGV